VTRRNVWITIGAVVVIAVVAIGIWQSRKPEGKVIKIGAILPLTGPAASFGEYAKDGIDLAVEEINKSSNLKFAVVYEDSKGQPKEAIAAYNKILATEKPAVVIAALSSVASVLSPLASSTNTILVLVDVAKPGVADGVNSFRIYPEANGTAGVIARFAANRLRARTAAVLYIDDAYGLASLDVFQKTFAQRGKTVFTDSYSISQRDFRDIIARLKSVTPRPDVVYLNGYGPAFVNAMRQLKEANLPIQLIADVAAGLPQNLAQAGSAAEGIYFVDANIPSQFVNSFRRKFGKEPSSDSAYAYDAIKILHKVATEVDKWDVASIRVRLKSLKAYPGIVGPITIRQNGDAELQFVVKRVVHGKPVVVE
jgi:branched-chain amino acid transport system substrate-binding protein